MTKFTSIIASILFFLACGQADQGGRSQSGPESLDADASVLASEASKITIDEQTKQAPGGGLAIPEGPIANQDPIEENETVSPPTQVTGTYMHASILLESETAVDIGLRAYHNGELVSMHPERLQAIWTVTQGGDPQVAASIETMPGADADVVLHMTGESLKAIRAQYSAIGLILQVKDLKLNKDTPVIQRSISVALQETAAKVGAP